MKIRVTYQQIVNRTVTVDVDVEDDMLAAYLEAPEDQVEVEVLEREYVRHVVLDDRNVTLPDVQARTDREDEW